MWQKVADVFSSSDDYNMYILYYVQLKISKEAENCTTLKRPRICIG